jgi:hypothetical protein
MEGNAKSQEGSGERSDNGREIRIINGKRCEKVYSGYTVRQYYSHSTLEKGPGPGWDIFSAAPDKICEKYGIAFKINIKPTDLPDEPHYNWFEVVEGEDDKEQ